MIRRTQQSSGNSYSRLNGGNEFNFQQQRPQQQSQQRTLGNRVMSQQQNNSRQVATSNNSAYYDNTPTRRQAAQQPAPISQQASRVQQSPVRRLNTVQDFSPWSQEDSEAEFDTYQGTAIRPQPQPASQPQPQQQVRAFKGTETSLCLVPQSPSVIQISQLLKGDKGDQGPPGDSHFKILLEDATTIQSLFDNLLIPGKLSVNQLEIRNPLTPQLLAAGEGSTSEEGQITIQLSRELKGTWNSRNAKVILTPRQLGGQLYIPLSNGFDCESNQFTVICSEKQKVFFDWFFYRI